MNAPRPSELLLLFLTLRALVANPKKTTLHGGQSRSWSTEQGEKKKKKVRRTGTQYRDKILGRVFSKGFGESIYF